MPNPYAIGTHVQQTALDITATAGSVQIVDFATRVKLLRWGNTVTTAIAIATASQVDAVITLFKLDFDRSTQTSLDTFTCDTTRAVGHVHYNDLHGVAATNNVIQPGEAIEIDHTTAAAGTTPTAAGGVKIWFTYEILGPIWNSTYHHSF